MIALYFCEVESTNQGSSLVSQVSLARCREFGTMNTGGDILNYDDIGKRAVNDKISR